MFDRSPQKNDHAPLRPAASEVARIQGGGLVQLIVTSLAPLTFFLFLNDTAVPQTDVESLSVSIEAPEDGDPAGGIVRASLSRYVRTVTGERTVQLTDLFPCTLEIVALGRRLSISSAQANSLEGVWINLGLRPDGTSSEVSGARALQVVLGDGLLDARLTWNDGETEELLPQTSTG